MVGDTGEPGIVERGREAVEGAVEGGQNFISGMWNSWDDNDPNNDYQRPLLIGLGVGAALAIWGLFSGGQNPDGTQPSFFDRLLSGLWNIVLSVGLAVGGFFAFNWLRESGIFGGNREGGEAPERHIQSEERALDQAVTAALGGRELNSTTRPLVQRMSDALGQEGNKLNDALAVIAARTGERNVIDQADVQDLPQALQQAINTAVSH